jgi:hypothetical protein
MTHAEAVGQQIAEKYVLGELAPEVREQFEDHYFDCAECASDLKALASLMAAGKAVCEEGFSAEIAIPDKRTEKAGWFTWLRPIVAVPAIAALAGILIFQNAGLIPVWKKPSANQPNVQIYELTYRLQGITRGESGSKISVNPHESFGLDFDFTPTESAPSYKGSLLDASGTALLTFTVNGAAANKELHLVVPAKTVHAGDYNLVFTEEGGGPDTKSKEVQRLSFTVDFRP